MVERHRYSIWNRLGFKLAAKQRRAYDFPIPEKGGKTGMFKAIQEQITYLYKEKRQPLLLAIDEAQYLNTGILNDIKMLMNYGYDSVNYFTLILCGESHLNDTLRKPVHEALRQRINVK